MVANKYAFLQITRRRFLNEWEAFKKVISRRNIRRRITIPLTLSNLKLLRRITRTENILHRNFTRRQVAIQNRVASNIGITRAEIMSQVTQQSVRFQTALASIKLIQASAVLDLTEDDFDFLTSNKVWIATDRSRARRCVEPCVYGTLDFAGYPRFPAPVGFIAAIIAYYVRPVNIQTAFLIMEGAAFTENIINGVERPVKAAELFAFTLRVRAGNTDVLTDAEENVRQKLRAEGVM